MGLPGFRVILFIPAMVRDPAGPWSAFACAPALRWSSLLASQDAAFRANDPLGTGTICTFGAKLPMADMLA